MGVFRQFPYSNFHEMNMDDIIKIVKNMLEEWAQYHADWEAWMEEINDDWSNYQEVMNEAWEDMQDFVNNYFDNLDVQTEINNKITAMVASGEFATIVSPYVPPAVSAWLASHITVPETIVIDDSLSIAGAAADAKATGDLLSDLKSSMYAITGNDEITGWSANNQCILLNGTTADITSPYTLPYDCHWVAVSASEGDVFTVTASGNNLARAWAFAKSDGDIILKALPDTSFTNEVIVAPANTAMLIINDLNLTGRSYIGEFLINKFNYAVKDSDGNILKTEDVKNQLIDYTDYFVGTMNYGSVDVGSVSGYWRTSNGELDPNTTVLIGTTKIPVIGSMGIEAEVTGNRYYLSWENDGTFIEGVRQDVGLYQVPTNARFVAVDYMAPSLESVTIHTIYPILKELESLEARTPEGKVACVTSGDAIQVKSKLNNTNKYIALNAYKNNGANGQFNMSDYIISNTAAEDASFLTGTVFKYADDDVTPVKANGSNLGGNHGKEPVYKITLTGHGKTEEDIGSVWTSANGLDYVIYTIDDDDNFSVIGDLNNSYTVVTISQPTSPLTHTSGATHTDQVDFTSATRTQLRPCINRNNLVIRNEHGNELISDGFIVGEYIEIVESYNIISIAKLVAYLKSNVGDCDNNTYHSDNIDGGILVQNIYRFTDGGGESVCVNITPLENTEIESFGGVQSKVIGDSFYVPFTIYDTIQTQDSNNVILDSTKWNDTDFPPYKYYQFNGNNGFVVGYNIDTEQGDPTYRKNLCSENACTYAGSTHKVYPYFYNKASHPNVLGNSFCFYAFRAPLIKSNNMTSVWYETADATYLELEFFNTFDGLIDFPKNAYGKKVSVIAKTDSVTIPEKILNTGSMRITANTKGSLTLKFK